ncbi:MAG: hypothetical protein FJW21_01530 [Acidimicrobiia bacterium]|nr:hypothetical protein [Acidimicrobiia bacterium]
MALTLKVPHTLTLLFLLMATAMAATWVIPQGRFQTAATASGRQAVVPGTFELTAERTWLTHWDLFVAAPPIPYDHWVRFCAPLLLKWLLLGALVLVSAVIVGF